MQGPAERPARRAARSQPVARGDRVTIDVDRLGDGPDGLGKIGDYVVFTPGVLPGERATVAITSAARKFGRAELVALRRRSPDRVEPRCAHFPACGGCQWQHLDYQAQLREKQARLQRALTFALGDAAPVAAPTVPADAPYGQRHKIALQLANDPDLGLVAALHRARSLELVPIDHCPAGAPAAVALALRTVALLRSLQHRAFDPERAPDGLLRAVLVRRTTGGEAHVVIVAQRPQVAGLARIVADLHAAGATAIAINHNPGEPSRLLGPSTIHFSGPMRIAERIGDLTFPISATAFFQTAPAMAAKLAAAVVAWLDPRHTDTVLDLYCGGGLLTLPLAARARQVIGVDGSAAAIADARAAAAANGIGNASWRSGDADGWLQACGRGLPRPDLVVVDPPRRGLSPQAIAQLGRLRPLRLAYVSCDPQALQRDLAALAAAGFATAAATPFDMFPQTAHVESLVRLTARR